LAPRASEPWHIAQVLAKMRWPVATAFGSRAITSIGCFT
jgi:hypothetical protein